MAPIENPAGLVADAVRNRDGLGPAAYRQKSLEIMSALNRERVFRIKIPVYGWLARWHAQLAGMSVADMASTPKQLDAAIDGGWETGIRPVLLRRFPNATPDELRWKSAMTWSR